LNVGMLVDDRPRPLARVCAFLGMAFELPDFAAMRHAIRALAKVLV
jgi:hypothetical protein